MTRLHCFLAAFSLSALTASAALAIGPDTTDNERPRVAPGFDAYVLDLADAARNSRKPRLALPSASTDLTGGRVQQFDAPMNKAVFLWAGVNEPVPVVGPLKPSELIDARAREFLRRQGPAMGLTPAALDTAELFDVQDLGHGPQIARYEQRVNGLEVFNRSLNVMLDRNGRPVAASGYFATRYDVADVLAAPFVLSPAAAIAAAFAQMGGQIHAGALVQVDSRGDYLHFDLRQPAAGAVQLAQGSRAKRVYYPRADTLEPGYYVELAATDNATGRSLVHSYVISAATGEMLFRNDLVDYEAYAYRVFADTSGAYQPFDAPLGNGYTPFPAASRSTPITRTGADANLVTFDYGPISTGDPWLPPGATETLGNNVDACLDSFDNAANGVISTPTNTCDPELGDMRPGPNGPNAFDYPITADGDPSTADARNAAIVNLFYINNWLHDWWYDHGFDEAARNAQTDNYGRGGADGDPVKAQGQDSSGRNNANMSTPADGSSPTMQQYLFDGFVTGEVRELTPVDSGPLAFSGAAFGPGSFDITGTVVLAADGAGVSPSDGCGAAPINPTLPTPPAAPQASLNGKIALIDRGNCNFTTKAQFATSSNAIGMIVVNNTDGDPITMGNGDVPVNAGASPSDPAYQIAAVMIRKADGLTVKGHLGAGAVTMKMLRLAARDQDGTLDNQIIAHEYFHYVSNRLINNANGLNNQQGGGMGEGWGDISALMLSVRADDRSAPDNDRYQGAYGLAWYVTNNFWAGIRRGPYSTDFAKNAFTFKHISDGTATPDGGPGTSNSEVHNTGEIWANMVWECYAGILNLPGRSFDQAQSRMQDYLVAGMKMTPASPTFTEARDGILAAAWATDYADFAACARGFARRGAGVHAVPPARSSTTNVGVTESYIALVARLPLVRYEFIPDPNDYCDADSVLDSGESGTLALTFRNDGTFVPAGPVSAVVSTTDPAVTLANGGRVTLPALGAGESATITLGITAGTFAASPATVPLSIAFEPVAAGDPAVEDPVDLDTSVFANHDGGLRNFDDMEDTTTSPVDWSRSATGAASWTQKPAAATQGNGKAWFGNDPATAASAQLLTPVFHVPAGGSFSMEFVHFFDFETDFDGGVIEVQVDGGGWTDAIAAGARFTQGNGYNNTAIAVFNDGPGFSGTNDAKEAMTLDFGTTLGGHDARLRFRLASDANTGGDGWYVDDVKLNGIAEPVFSFFVTEDGVCLQPIKVSAGSDFPALEHPAGSSGFSTVQLRGSVTDPNSPPVTLAYQWAQVSGPAVTLTESGTLAPRFAAPSVSADTVLEFQLIVTTGNLILGLDDVAVTITSVNLAPVAAAGPDAPADEGQGVDLDGTASTEPDGELLAYAWQQTAGPTVALADATTATPSFTAPSVDGEQVLGFRLTVSDPLGAVSTDDVTVTVRESNFAPLANAGQDFAVDKGTRALLNGSKSTDGDAGDTLTYAWTQVSGPAATLTNGDTATATFMAPPVNEDTALTFRLTVSDLVGASSSDDILVTVRNTAPIGPNARLAGAWSPAALLMLGLLALLGAARRQRVSTKV